LSLKIFLGDRFVDEKQAKVSVFDHCLLYGDGVFEGIRLYRGCVFRLVQHIERLYSSAKYIMLKIPMSQKVLIEKVCETVRRNGLRDGYIRLVVTRCVGPPSPPADRCTKPNPQKPASAADPRRSVFEARNPRAISELRAVPTALPCPPPRHPRR